MVVSRWNLPSQMLVAIDNNDEEKAEKLLEAGVDCDFRFNVGSQRKPAICICVEKGYIDLVRLLLTWGCSINQADTWGLTPLHIAAVQGYENMVTLLLQHRGHVNAVNQEGQTPLHLAAPRSSVAILRALVEAGADIGRTDRHGKTPLLYCCECGNTAGALYLLLNGASVRTVDSSGCTALHYAVSTTGPAPQVLSQLIMRCANLDACNKLYQAPIHVAINSNRKDRRLLVQQLVSSGCDLDIKMPFGQTPLLLACMKKDESLIRVLVLAGCDVNLCDNLGRTALFHAVSDGNLTVAKFLVEAGTKVTQNSTNLYPLIHDDEFKEWLLVRSRNVQPLTSLCRLAFRNGHKHISDQLITKLTLPRYIKNFMCYST